MDPMLEEGLRALHQAEIVCAAFYSYARSVPRPIQNREERINVLAARRRLANWMGRAKKDEDRFAVFLSAGKELHQQLSAIKLESKAVAVAAN